MDNSKPFAIRSENIYTLVREPFAGYVVIQNGRIKDVIAENTMRLTIDTVYDVGPAYVFPGFIDLHIHGSGGWSVFSHSGDDIVGLSRYLAAWGTTAYYPTIATAPADVIRGVIEATRKVQGTPSGGAEVLGLHMEGPFLSYAKKGAQRTDSLLAPSWPLVQQWLEMGAGLVKRITLAPELDGAVPLIDALVDCDVVVAGGHTAATYDETLFAIDHGVTVANHTFNAMKELGHREPGAVGAYMTDDRIFCELIADGIHVHTAAIKVLARVAGEDRVCLVTDAVPSAGMPAGHYRLEGREVLVSHQGACTLPDGTIAGSTATMLGDVRLFAAVTGSLTSALKAASLNPARAMGIAHRKGAIAVGRDADMVVVGKDWNVLMTFVRGQMVYQASDGSVADLLNPNHGFQD